MSAELRANQADILNVAGYKFVSLAVDGFVSLRTQLKAKAAALELKGTILLAPEGINLYFAGKEPDVLSFIDYLEASCPHFKGIHYKRSWSEHRPYTRMLVRIKQEAISFGQPEVKPGLATARHLDPKTLHQWYRQNKDMVLLDTRNDYEVKLGTFAGAQTFDIRTFKQFIDKVDQLDDSIKNKPVVTFCTGGIRCEKAAEYMQQQGFTDVYQLNGGILHYFEQCGGDYYEGDCFVFDKRVAVNPALAVTDAQVCYSCRMPLLPGDFDEADLNCPLCHKSRFGKGHFALQEVQESIKQVGCAND